MDDPGDFEPVTRVSKTVQSRLLTRFHFETIATGSVFSKDVDKVGLKRGAKK